MRGKSWRIWLVGIVTAGAMAAVFSLAPIPQDPAYHEFADRRGFFDIPHFGNVCSNLAFVLVGVFGLSRLSRLPDSAPRKAYRIFCLGVIGVGVGSGYYHWAPAMPPLAWDRLPMSVAFMALLAMVVRDRLSPPLGDRLLWPLLAAGSASVAYWFWSELQGHGDLRAYALVQFLPMLLLPLLLTIDRGRGLSTPWLWGVEGTYALAKAAEHFDAAIYAGSGLISGHSLKHLLGALAALCLIFAVRPTGSKASPAASPSPEARTERIDSTPPLP